jgi:hypothetical protein
VHLPVSVPCPPQTTEGGLSAFLPMPLSASEHGPDIRHKTYDPIIGWLPLLPCSAPPTCSPCWALGSGLRLAQIRVFPKRFHPPKRGMNCSSPTSSSSMPSFHARLILTPFLFALAAPLQNPQLSSHTGLALPQIKQSTNPSKRLISR